MVGRPILAPLPDGVDRDEALSAICDELFLRGFRDVQVTGDTIAFGPRRLLATIGSARMATSLLGGGTVRVTRTGTGHRISLDLFFRRMVLLVCGGLLAWLVFAVDDTELRILLVALLAVFCFFFAAIALGVVEGIVRGGLDRAAEGVRLRTLRPGQGP